MASAQTCAKATSPAGCVTGVITASSSAGGPKEFSACIPGSMAPMMYKSYWFMKESYVKEKICPPAVPKQMTPNMTAADGPEVLAAIAAQKVCAAKTTAADCTGDCKCNGDETCTLSSDAVVKMWKVDAKVNLFPTMLGCLTSYDKTSCAAKSSCKWEASADGDKNLDKCKMDEMKIIMMCVTGTETTSGSTPIPGVALALLAAVMSALVLML